MKSWAKRPKEEAYLLNPAFCSTALTASIAGYTNIDTEGMPLRISFLVLPIILHKQTREILPIKITTSLPAWIQENASAKILFYERAKSLTPYTKEAILFGLMNDMLEIQQNGKLQSKIVDSKVVTLSHKLEEEAKECVSRARFVGRWLASAGSPQTVMALWGVCP